MPLMNKKVYDTEQKMAALRDGQVRLSVQCAGLQCGGWRRRRQQQQLGKSYAETAALWDSQVRLGHGWANGFKSGPVGMDSRWQDGQGLPAGCGCCRSECPGAICGCG